MRTDLRYLSLLQQCPGRSEPLDVKGVAYEEQSEIQNAALSSYTVRVKLERDQESGRLKGACEIGGTLGHAYLFLDKHQNDCPTFAFTPSTYPTKHPPQPPVSLPNCALRYSPNHNSDPSVYVLLFGLQPPKLDSHCHLIEVLPPAFKKLHFEHKSQ